MNANTALLHASALDDDAWDDLLSFIVAFFIVP